MFPLKFKLKGQFALAGVAQLLESWPMNQRVTGSIPSQGTYPGCGRQQIHISFFLSFTPSLKINKHILE